MIMQKKGVANGKRVVTMYKSKPEGNKFCKSIWNPMKICFHETNPHPIYGPSFDISRDSTSQKDLHIEISIMNYPYKALY